MLILAVALRVKSLPSQEHHYGSSPWTSCIPSWQLEECTREYALHITQSDGPAELCVKVYNARKATGALGPLSIMVTLQFRTKLAPISNIGIKLILFMRPSYTVNNTPSSSTVHLTLCNCQFLQPIHPVCSTATCPLFNLPHHTTPYPTTPTPITPFLLVSAHVPSAPSPPSHPSGHSAPGTHAVFHTNNTNAIPTCWDFAAWACSRSELNWGVKCSLEGNLNWLSKTRQKWLSEGIIWATSCTVRC